LGINGKISELQAAMGLAVLPYMEEILEGRKAVVNHYNSQLDYTPLSKLKLRENTNWNYSYYPVFFETEAILLKVIKALNEKDIFPRRYFYPSLNNTSIVTNRKMIVSDDLSSKILCLPLYHDLNIEKVDFICKIILGILN
jgi:dTDP-4-amino-4,6-dideoxygalactose transaminase